MKKKILVMMMILGVSLMFACEKHIAEEEDLKIELFPELKGEELAVDIKITNISGRTCYIDNVFLNFEYFDDEWQQYQMAGTIIDMEDENGIKLWYCGIMGTIIPLSKWEKGYFTRLGKGQSITGHIRNLLNSYPKAKDCEYVTIYYNYQLGKSEPVTVKLK